MTFGVILLLAGCGGTSQGSTGDSQVRDDGVTIAEQQASDSGSSSDQNGPSEKLPSRVDYEESNDTFESRYELVLEESAALVSNQQSTVLLLNDRRQRYNPDDHLDLHRVLAQDPVTDTFIEVGFWTLYYADPADDLQAYQDYQRRVLSVAEHFGEWNGYFYTADHNGNGIEELIGFQLAGCCFAPEVWEYSDGAFHQVLDVSLLSDNMLAIEIPGPGEFVFYGPNYVTGDYLRFAFEWNSESGMYELTEQNELTSYPATP